MKKVIIAMMKSKKFIYEKSINLSLINKWRLIFILLDNIDISSSILLLSTKIQKIKIGKKA